jgi:glycosyltransferase involved in cell wall biosynthesis
MTGQTGRVPVSVIVLTKDEARNLPACLESVAEWAAEVLVVDSGSTDGTPDTAAGLGARVFTHAFESHAKQWGWALRSLPISGEWVLALDADQRVTPELRREIARATTGGGAPDEPVAYYVPRRQIFRGRRIRHGGYYPKYLLKLFRRGEAWCDERDLVDHHFYVKGLVGRLRGDLLEDNRNEADLSAWIAKHARYAALQAREELVGRWAGADPAAPARLLGTPDERTRWLKRWWGRLPLYVRPFLYFGYRYVLRGGFLDGKEGFVFHFLQGFWYRLLVDVHLDQLRAEARGRR